MGTSASIYIHYLTRHGMLRFFQPNKNIILDCQERKAAVWLLRMVF